MARTGITLVREHGEQEFDVVSGPDVPLHQQINDFKRMAAASNKTHPAFAQVEIWTSSEGRIKHIKFSKPEKPAAAPVAPPPMPPAIDEPIATDVAPASDPVSDNSTEETPADAKAPSPKSSRRK